MRLAALCSFAIWTLQVASGAETAISVVASLSGAAKIVSKNGFLARDLVLFDWIASGDTVTVPKGSTVILVFGNGGRFELRDGAKATLTLEGLTNASGTIRKLSSVPVLPRLPSFEDGEKTAIRSGAVRLVRAASIPDLYPGSGARSLPDETVLRFSPVSAAIDYTLVMEDATGYPLLNLRTPSFAVKVPPGLLKPESRYHWRVQANVVLGPSYRSEADFSTLSRTEIERRKVWQAIIAESKDVDLTLLAAELDRQLGLLSEAHDKLVDALKVWPDDNKVRVQLSKEARKLDK